MFRRAATPRRLNSPAAKPTPCRRQAVNVNPILEQFILLDKYVVGGRVMIVVPLGVSIERLSVLFYGFQNRLAAVDVYLLFEACGQVVYFRTLQTRDRHGPPARVARQYTCRVARSL